MKNRNPDTTHGIQSIGSPHHDRIALTVGIVIPSNNLAGIQKLAAIIANDLAHNGCAVNIYIPRLPYYYYFVTLRRRKLQWIRVVRHYVTAYLKDRTFVYEQMLRKKWTGNRIRVQNVFRKPSKRQLKRQDCMIVMTIAQVAELKNRFPEDRIIYQIHHPEETVYEFPEVFKNIRSRFKGKMLAISPWTARTVSGPAVPPPVVPDVVSPVFWTTRRQPDRQVRGKDILFHFSRESHKGGDVGEAIIQSLIRIRPGIRYTVWSRDEVPNLPVKTVYRYMSEDELCEMYRSHKLLLFPSTFEGFGLPPIESMACGCIPVLYPRIGAAELYAEDGKNVIFIDDDIDQTARRINILLDDETSLKRMQAAALAAVSDFGPDGYGRRLLDAAGIPYAEKQGLHRVKGGRQ